jgi:hypothetical protein
VCMKRTPESTQGAVRLTHAEVQRPSGLDQDETQNLVAVRSNERPRKGGIFADYGSMDVPTSRLDEACHPHLLAKAV